MQATNFMFHDASTSLAQRDAIHKQKMKVYADQRENGQERKIIVGETVLMKQPKQNKLSTPNNPKPFIVEETKESMITVSNRSETVTRNSSNFKLVLKHFVQDSGKKKKGVEIPTIVDKTPVVQPNSDSQEKHSLKEITKANQDPC